MCEAAGVNVRWLTLFLDTPREGAETAEAFWQQVTGTTLSPRRGDHDEYATLVPPDGDAFVRVQRIERGAPRCHLDIHVDDVRAALSRATDLGAKAVSDHAAWVVLSSPGGLPWCLVPHHGEHVRPTPLRRPGGWHSLIDQLCLDIPADRYDAETAFWSALTGWEQREGALPEFDYLAHPDGMPLRLLLQKLDDAQPARPVSAHVDLACDDVDAEAQQHVDLGATFVRRRSWVTLVDPVGREYCITSRRPLRGS